ncbi:hypothetical protein [Candidatus Magnetobacterium casense]|uniref:Uncharacterized protein n=1 Tax=Candidatus Magnetobacterium casense TaxID=1455061 RepID=A0ABS6RXV3_9BACT|nr:hypothetical protein [Candidatus Magnetobacterium casensis]MBV6341477.1 hypothetical protein [Candidatus Magnetobacterium casensis]
MRNEQGYPPKENLTILRVKGEAMIEKQKALDTIRSYLQDVWNEGDGHYPLTDTSEQILALFQPSQPTEGELAPCPYRAGRVCPECGSDMAWEWEKGSKAQRQFDLQRMVKLPSEDRLFTEINKWLDDEDKSIMLASKVHKWLKEGK